MHQRRALRGNDYDTELCQRISELTGAPTVSTIGAVRAAIEASGAASIGVITPYVDELNEKIKASIEDDGIDVAGITGLGITDNFQIAEAVRHVGNVRVRNRGTIGGSLAHADPTSEIGCCALAAGARVVARGPAGNGQSDRTVPASELFAGYWATTLDTEEIITDVLIPVARPRQGTRSPATPCRLSCESRFAG